MNNHTPRTFEVPAALVAAGIPPTVTLDVLDREVEFPGEYGEWAEKVLFSENLKTLTDVCGDMRLLPRGILASVQLDDGSMLISGLVDSDGRVWNEQSNSWEAPTEEINVAEGSVILDDDEIAFVARALLEGADEVWFRPYIPKAFVSAVVAAPETESGVAGESLDEDTPEAQQVPDGSAIIAVVDPIDEDAVLEMLAIAPGPRVLRRHAGNWFEDPEWVEVLKSVKPPSIVKLTDAQIASVTPQVDRATSEEDWEPFEVEDREQYQIFTASASSPSPYLQELRRESDEAALFGLVAVAGRKLTPKDAIATERLKRYWTVGKGAAKIRWGTPGSWRRCHRHLVKYVGPHIAPGYCTNLAKRLGGHGVATHVTSSADVIVAANPTGINAYDKGKSFEEATGGVVRDDHGRFAPEGGSSPRAGRRSKSVGKSRGSWDTGKAKFKLLPKEERGGKKKGSAEAEKRKAEAEAKRARKAAQREELARISVEIARLRAADRDLEAAEMRVRYAELSLSFAESAAQKLNAQAALINAQDALRNKKLAIAKKKRREAEKAAKKKTSDAQSRYREGYSTTPIKKVTS